MDSNQFGGLVYVLTIAALIFVAGAVGGTLGYVILGCVVFNIVGIFIALS